MMTRRTSASVVNRIGVGWGLCGTGLSLVFLLVSPPALSQASRPSVRARLEIHAPTFSGLSAQDVAGVKAHVANHVIGKASAEWPFVDWTPDLDPALNPDGEWLVKLEEEPFPFTHEDGEVVQYSIVRLKHYTFRRGQGPSEVRLPSGTVILYEAGQIKPGRDSPKLQSDLDALLEKQLTGEFLDEIEATLLGGIPIGDQVISELPPNEPDKGRIIIPLRLADMQASRDSTFRVTFSNVVDTVTGDTQEGTLRMNKLETVLRGELSGCFFGRIDDFVRFPLIIQTPFYNHPEVHALLNTAEKQVFIVDYKRGIAGDSTTPTGEFITAPN